MAADHLESSPGFKEWQPNDTVGGYVLQECLGERQHSSTFQAASKTKEIVAIKLFSKSSPLGKALYEAEIAVYKAVRDVPGILPIKDHGEERRGHFIVTEFIPEGSLRNIFETYPSGMEIEDAIKLFTPIADTVDHIHGKNVIHRDLKPENILVAKTENGFQTFVTDFGLSIVVDDSLSYTTQRLYGTPGYLAPEAWDPNAAKTNALDIYVFGLLLYEALEGRRPFENADDVLTMSVPFPRRTSQKANAEITHILLRTLNKNPKERPLSAGEIIDTLRNAYFGTAEAASERWVGYQVKNYIVEEVLGHGKMGLTMRARDQRGKQYVLKAFASRSLTDNPKQLFDQEIESLQRLENGHGVLIPLEHFSQDGILFIAMDYQPGGNLRKFLEENRRGADVEKILDVFSQIASAIDYIHSKRIIHCDLKPQNIVYRQDGIKVTAYLTDFGIAKILEGTRSSFYTKTTAGTFYYMAPEAWEPRARKTKAMDIYAFGVMLYEALEGHVPFKAEYPAIMYQHTHEPVPEPKNTAKKRGPGARNILLQALEKKPQDRPKTAKEIVEIIKGQVPDYLGKRYGKYEVESLIGQSAIGATYKAFERPRRTKKVALKTLPFSEPINHEINILKKLKPHEGILPLIDSGSENGVHYLVTDYLSGGNLREYLDDHPGGIPLDQTLEFFKPIARAIDFLHSNGIIHRDLKPENIVLKVNKVDGDTRIQPYVTDFGISRIIEKTPTVYSKTNVIAGTYRYIAPEVLDDQKPSPANDIYALGIMIYEALEGQPPFNARTPASIMKQQVNDLPPPPENLARSHGEKAAAVLLKALEKKPEKRQRTAQELVLELEMAARKPVTTFSGILSQPLKSLFAFFRSPKTKRALRVGAPLLLVAGLAYFTFSRPLLFPPTPTSTLTSTFAYTQASSPSATRTLLFSATLSETATITSAVPSIQSSLTKDAKGTKTPGFVPPSSQPTNTAVRPTQTSHQPTIPPPKTIEPTDPSIRPTATHVQPTRTPVPPANTPDHPRQCSDHTDNDGDGKTDMDDPDCKNKGDDSESS